MELKNGGLYETKRGVRYRVTETDPGIFECRSFGGTWGPDGRAYGKVWVERKFHRPHLVKEVEESRWIPASREKWASTAPGLRFIDGKHRQILVSREEAQAVAQEGREKAKAVTPPAIPVTSGDGEVRLLDKWGFNVGFNWKITKDNQSILEIETTSGVKISLPL